MLVPLHLTKISASNLPFVPLQVCRNAAYKLDCPLCILIVFNGFLEGTPQTQGTQTEIKQWKDWLRLRLHLVNTPQQETIGQETRSRIEKEQFCSCSWILAIYSHFRLETSHPPSGSNWDSSSEPFIVLWWKIFQQPGEAGWGYPATKIIRTFNVLVDDCTFPGWAESHMHN